MSKLRTRDVDGGPCNSSQGGGAGQPGQVRCVGTVGLHHEIGVVRRQRQRLRQVEHPGPEAGQNKKTLLGVKRVVERRKRRTYALRVDIAAQQNLWHR